MCTSPLRAFYTGSKTENGKDVLALSKSFRGLDMVRIDVAQKSTDHPIVPVKGFTYMMNGYLYLYKHVDVPCGHCDECRAAHAAEWARRCMLEADHSHDCWFVTLTYDDAHNPIKLVKEHFQLFMKRLRKKVGPGVRFFANGEYGTHTKRCHFHALLFNCPLTLLPNGHAKEIDDCWRYGFHMVDVVNKDRCAYVARYCDKKLNESLPPDFPKPFILMSRRPGIGERWLKENMEQILETDRMYFAFSEKELSAIPPRYFDKLTEKEERWSNSRETNKAFRQVNGYRMRQRDKAILKMDDDDLDEYKRNIARLNKERKEKSWI